MSEQIPAPEIDLPEDEERLEPIEHDGEDDVKMADATNDDLQIDISAAHEPFYLRYYSGHQGRFGHEFFEFDVQVQDDGKYAMLRYANNSNYRQEGLIKKSVALSPTVFKEFKRILADCEILKEDDKMWPPANRDGKQELELRLGRFHISFETAKIGSMNEVQQCRDPEGLRVFYYAVQDLKALVFSLVQCHFKIKPFSA